MLKNFGKLPTYWKAITAFLGALATFLATIQANAAITETMPSNWSYAIGALLSMLTGGVTYKKANNESDPVQAAIDRYKANPANVTEAVVTNVVTGGGEVVNDVLSGAVQDVPKDILQAGLAVVEDVLSIYRNKLSQ